MDIMKDFEGIKKINNDLNLDIDKLYEILSKYKEQIGDVFFADDKDKLFVIQLVAIVHMYTCKMIKL